MNEWSDEQARERFSAAAAQFYRYGYKNGDEPINREEREQSVGRALLTLEAERDEAERTKVEANASGQSWMDRAIAAEAERDALREALIRKNSRLFAMAQEADSFREFSKDRPLREELARAYAECKDMSALSATASLAPKKEDS